MKLEVLSWIIEKKFHSEQDNRSISEGFDVMLPVPIKVQANVPVHLKATITGRQCDRFFIKKTPKTVETNGITINFETEKANHFDEIILSENLNEIKKK